MIKIFKLKKIIIILIIIFFSILGFFYYKKNFCGNNIIENRINEVFNNLENYSAEMSVEIISNKTNKNYKIYQEKSDTKCFQKVLEGEYLKGLEIVYANNVLQISNPNINLEKKYENYVNLTNNSLFLENLINEFYDKKNSTKVYEENEQIVVEIKVKSDLNTYIYDKKLYVDNKTLLPVKYNIKNNVENCEINIVYTNIEIK